MRKFYCILTAVFIFQLGIFAQDFKSPSEFLGYELGTQFSRHHQVVDYFKYVANELPNMVKLEKYGETYERRPLYTAFVSSPANLQNLETIRANNLRRVGINKDGTGTDEIAIVWLSYNVHGNEASSTEASMNTIYKLLSEKKDWLENTVVIIDPCINPDGRDRYANWYNETRSSPYDRDPQASEHNEPWPGGRPNHYLFDLNRDWAWASQIESQHRLKVYNKWLPHIHVDFHEQGINSPYYFAPAAEPYHEIISDWQREFQTIIGKNHARYFDENGWLFFTKESFDLLYPSYGDTYPTFMGAIGMTYEQAGHGRAGLGINNDEGIELTLKDRIAHHTTTGLSTVEVASKNAEKLISEFKKFFNTSALKNKSYVLRGPEDNLESLASLLDKHEIGYSYSNPNRIFGYNYSTQNLGSLRTNSNDLVVSVNQPKGKMVKALLEPKAFLSDSLTYDITAWSLPLAYGLEAIASEKLISGSEKTKTAVINTVNKEAVAYILKWGSLKDAQFLAELLRNDFKIRFSGKEFSTNGEDYKRGSLIIIRGDNPKMDDFDEQIVSIANAHGRQLYNALSGFSSSGPDFGSPDINLVNKQRVAILSGNYTSSLSYGALWHFFEQQIKYPLTSINTENFNRTDLNQYDVLIMPDGFYNGLIKDSEFEKLSTWVKHGGKLIAIDGALNSLAGKKGLKLSIKEMDKDDSTSSIKSKDLIPYANRERENAKNLITGAIFKTQVDNTHPMAYGYPNYYFTLKRGNDFFKLLQDGHNVAYLGSNPIKLSGFAGSEALAKLDETLVFGEERLGRGSIIYFVDDVMFRSFWENGKLFLVNSIFFVNNNVFRL